MARNETLLPLLDGNNPLVYFDLETTGLKDPDILQIGALVEDCSDSFDRVLKPISKESTREAQEINKLKYNQERKEMYRIFTKDEKLCKSVEAKTGLLEFIIWLKNVAAGKILWSDFINAST